MGGAIGQQQSVYDIVIIGAGTAGLAAALQAVMRGLSVCLVEAADDIGGTLHLANGQISGGGTSLQHSRAIEDSPEQHYQEILELTEGRIDKAIVRTITEILPEIIDSLMRDGLVPLPDHPVTGAAPGQAGYKTPRYLWDERFGRAILAVLRARFDKIRRQDRNLIRLITKCRAVDLEFDSSMTAQALLAEDEDRTLCQIKAKNFLFATGGYAMNPALFAEFNGGPAYLASSWPENLGKGLEILRSKGAKLRGFDLHRAGTGSILSRETFPATYVDRFLTNAAQRMPWEIFVNSKGERFVCEDKMETNTLARALARQDKFRYAIVFDASIYSQAPSGLPNLAGSKLEALWNQHPMFHRSDSLEALAALASIEPRGLVDTVAAYNRGIEQGSDPLGRSFCPRPIMKPPYYAIIHLGHSATSAVGVEVNANFQPLCDNGQVMKNVFAAGEILGSGVTLGDVFTPGMMIGAALAEGHYIANNLADRAATSV